jgi:hypothetical protein
LTRSAISSADVTSEISLGVEGKPFKFSQCVNQVSTAEMSALNGQVEEVERFIREQVKPQRFLGFRWRDLFFIGGLTMSTGHVFASFSVLMVSGLSCEHTGMV